MASSGQSAWPYPYACFSGEIMKAINFPFRKKLVPILVGIGLFLLVGIGTAAYVHRDFLHIYTFPGPLSGVNRGGEALGGFSSHAMFEQECVHCHAPVHCITDTKCQDCHMDVARQRAEALGLHSLFPGTEKCQTCHVEHRGRDAVISAVLLRNINHQQLSGFTLALHETRFDGTAMICEDCHTEGRFARDEVSCVACHAEADGELIAQHSAEHGENCLGCHDGTGYIVDFDHDTAYLLEAGHEDVACVACHAAQQFAGTSQVCGACHQEPDVHDGQFGQDCMRCHTAVAWAPAQLTQHRFNLNHGDGVTLECNACHTATYVEVSCASCHEAADMQAAHTPAKAPDYTANLACASCHPTGEPADTLPVAQAGN